MMRAAASGCEMKATWLPATSSVVAFIRLAYIRSTSGGITWSFDETRYHEGLVLQAGWVIGTLKTDTASGTWESYMNARVSIGTSGAKPPRKASRLKKARPSFETLIGSGPLGRYWPVVSPSSGPNAAR